MDIIEQFAEIRRDDAFEEAIREEMQGEIRRFIKKLLKEPSLTLEEIAIAAKVSLERVKKMRIISICEQLAEIKRKDIIEECRAKEYAEDYSIRYARSYAESYKVGLQDGIELANRRLVGDS